jgi:hypothetical protein
MTKQTNGPKISKSVANLVEVCGDETVVGGQSFDTQWGPLKSISKARVNMNGGPVIRVVDAYDEISYVYRGRLIEREDLGMDTNGRTCAPTWDGYPTVRDAALRIDRKLD